MQLFCDPIRVTRIAERRFRGFFGGSCARFLLLKNG